MTAMSEFVRCSSILGHQGETQAKVTQQDIFSKVTQFNCDLNSDLLACKAEMETTSQWNQFIKCSIINSEHKLLCGLEL